MSPILTCVLLVSCPCQFHLYLTSPQSLSADVRATLRALLEDHLAQAGVSVEAMRTGMNRARMEYIEGDRRAEAEGQQVDHGAALPQASASSSSAFSSSSHESKSEFESNAESQSRPRSDSERLRAKARAHAQRPDRREVHVHVYHHYDGSPRRGRSSPFSDLWVVVAQVVLITGLNFIAKGMMGARTQTKD